MPKISTLKQIYESLNCQEKMVNGVCWFECNTNADKTVAFSMVLRAGKIDMAPLLSDMLILVMQCMLLICLGMEA